MARNIIAPDADRLPWLTEGIKRPKRSPSWVVSFVAASAVAIIAALSFWLGMSGWLSAQLNGRLAPDASIALPRAEATAEFTTQPGQVMPQVEPAPVPPAVGMPVQQDARLEAPPVRRFAAKRPVVTVHRSPPLKSIASKKESAEDKKELAYANPWKSVGVSGRMVRVGAYSSLDKGKDAWSRLATLSPAIKQLPAVVTDIPSPTGRTLYWLQIGTTSQAHSEVLCQRMRALGQRCVVVDVAGARKDSANERQSARI
jgi:hypothetical protein